MQIHSLEKVSNLKIQKKENILNQVSIQTDAQKLCTGLIDFAF